MSSIPSGKLVNMVNIQKTMENIGKSQFLMGKSTISLATFNSFLYVYQAGYPFITFHKHDHGDSTGFQKDSHAMINHQSWGTLPYFRTKPCQCMELGYMIGIDQKPLEKPS